MLTFDAPPGLRPADLLFRIRVRLAFLRRVWR